ncbi:MAG TPA: hypothetical protein VEA69_14990 [Tepidisphaeraceae bacterium]|nr:hypothetical protein [Tepidisphaeraceae bacterium]
MRTSSTIVCPMFPVATEDFVVPAAGDAPVTLPAEVARTPRNPGRFDNAAYKTPLHAQWRADRALRERLPLNEAWRGCLGLAVLLDQVEATVAHGDLALLPTANVTWLALRDVPVGRFPGSPAMNRRDVNYASTTVAGLRYSMPVIDFTRGGGVRAAVDFRFCPAAPHDRQFGPDAWDVERVIPGADTLDAAARAREFVVLNRVSAAMTRFALAAVDGGGRPVRPAWFARRPADVEPFRPAPLRNWMPRPYLAISPETADRLSYLLGLAPRSGRPVPAAVLDAFDAAVTAGEGLVLRTTGPSVFCGELRRPSTAAVAAMARDAAKLDLVVYRFKSELDGRVSEVLLPDPPRRERRRRHPVGAGVRSVHGGADGSLRAAATRAPARRGAVGRGRLRRQGDCSAP